jgi:hypothetical protein
MCLNSQELGGDLGIYKINHLLMENKQDLKEILSFEAPGAVS